MTKVASLISARLQSPDAWRVAFGMALHGAARMCVGSRLHSALAPTDENTCLRYMRRPWLTKLYTCTTCRSFRTTTSFHVSCRFPSFSIPISVHVSALSGATSSFMNRV